VLLEPLYTGKLLLALRQALERGEIAAGCRIVAVHSGGLQGRRALAARLQELARD
jgi:1-aminocyclopropane-1-carboxylate deaminase